MPRTIVLYILNAGLLLSTIAVCITGLIKFLAIKGVITPGLPRFIMFTLHDWSGVVMTLLVIFHIIYNFKWFTVTTRNFFKKKEEI